MEATSKFIWPWRSYEEEIGGEGGRGGQSRDTPLSKTEPTHWLTWPPRAAKDDGKYKRWETAFIQLSRDFSVLRDVSGKQVKYGCV